MIHLTGLSAQSATPTAQLADKEANCCLYPDETTLVEMHSITPVTSDIATLPKQDRDITYCNKMFYLPLTRTDDSIHMQPFYCTLMTDGAVVSTDSIMVTSPHIITWVQSGHNDKDAIFTLAWTYVATELDKFKKARCTCDGSTRGTQIRDMECTYANCVDQTSWRLFYAISTAGNLLAYADTPPSKQGFFICLDNASLEWSASKNWPPLPPGYVIPVKPAMQGHPKSPRLWERHINWFL